MSDYAFLFFFSMLGTSVPWGAKGSGLLGSTEATGRISQKKQAVKALMHF